MQVSPLTGSGSSQVQMVKSQLYPPPILYKYIALLIGSAPFNIGAYDSDVWDCMSSDTHQSSNGIHASRRVTPNTSRSRLVDNPGTIFASNSAIIYYVVCLHTDYQFSRSLCGCRFVNTATLKLESRSVIAMTQDLFVGSTVYLHERILFGFLPHF